MKKLYFFLVVMTGIFMVVAAFLDDSFRFFSPMPSWVAKPNANGNENEVEFEAEVLYDEYTDLRNYMVELINRDRQKFGLRPVRLHKLASQFGQGHSEEEAQFGYLSHWAIDGTKPYVRWSKLGGIEHVSENVFARAGSATLSPQDSTLFAEAQESLMRSPGHRANILDPHHNAVGIGIALDQTEKKFYLCQEFIDRYLTLEDFPRQVHRRQKVRIAGKVLHSDYGIYFCRVTYEPFPAPLLPTALDSLSAYLDSGEQTVLSLGPWALGVNAKKGTFAFEIDFAKQATKAGYYYLVLYVKKDRGQIPYSRAGNERATTAEAIPATSVVFEIRDEVN